MRNHPSRSWLVALAIALVVLLPTFGSVAQASEEEARKHFKAGVAYLQDPEGERFEEAYAEFKKAYELARAPKVLGKNSRGKDMLAPQPLAQDKRILRANGDD